MLLHYLLTDTASPRKRGYFILVLLAAAKSGNSAELARLPHHYKQSRIERLKRAIEPLQKKTAIQASRYSRRVIQSFDDDDWKYNPTNRLLQHKTDNQLNTQSDYENNNAKQNDGGVNKSLSQAYITIKPMQLRSVDKSSSHLKRKTQRQLFVDDDWRYHPANRLLQEEENDDNHAENGNGNNNANQNDDDCVTEKSYLAGLVNHMLYTTPEEWTMDEVVLGCCLALIALSTVLVALCCVYGCCAAYCCCCCEGKKKSSKRSVWDDDTTVSGYGLDYQFTNDSSLV